jgi:hypothetical protein
MLSHQWVVSPSRASQWASRPDSGNSKAAASLAAVARDGITAPALDLAEVGAVEVGLLGQQFLRPAAPLAEMPDRTPEFDDQPGHWRTLPAPPGSCWTLACVTWLPGGTLLVSQTLPPMLDPRPIVIRPRMVAPA